MKQKILMVGWGFPPNIDGGLDIHVAHLFEELEKKDIKVELVLPKERAPGRENVIGVETGNGDMVQKARKLSQEVAKIAGEYDIVHTHDWFGAEAGFKAKKYSGVGWISTFHSLSSSRQREPSPEIQKMERSAVEEADELIAVSRSLAENIEDEFERKSRVIYNGFSTPSSSGIDIKDRHGIDGKMIFYVGRHAEQKGIEHLIYAFEKLAEEGEDATLVIGGEGHTTDSLKEFVEILGLEDQVIFTGFIPSRELGDYYREAEVFVSPSINEPFGLTITEALESNTPVVATGSGAEEIAGDSIISVDGDSDSLKEGIEEAVEREKELEFENRSWKEMAEETVEAYKKLA